MKKYLSLISSGIIVFLFTFLSPQQALALTCSGTGQANCPSGQVCQGYQSGNLNTGGHLGTCVAAAANPPPANPQGGTVNVTCTCDHEGQPDKVDGNNQVIPPPLNGYHCSNGTYSHSDFCGHQEEYCTTKGAANNIIHTDTITNGTCGGRFGGTCTRTTVNYVGVTCDTTSTCGCKDGKTISCTNKGENVTQTFSCGTGTSCINKPGVNDTGFSFLNRPVSGVACVSMCKCDHAGPPTATNHSTGNGNNGWKCQDGSTGACPNREDYCTNQPSGTISVTCVNSSACTCNSDKSAIQCLSKGSGDGGQDENQNFQCDGPGLCVAGGGVDDPGFSFANQHITGIKCLSPVPPTQLPNPPSPPCKQWGNGVCQTFGSTFGGFSTDPNGFIQKIFAILLSVSGGIALLLIIKAGYQLMTAQGKPEQLQNARDQLVAAIVGLVFLIFSFVFLQLIGFDILKIPGFGQ